MRTGAASLPLRSTAGARSESVGPSGHCSLPPPRPRADGGSSPRLPHGSRSPGWNIRCRPVRTSRRAAGGSSRFPPTEPARLIANRQIYLRQIDQLDAHPLIGSGEFPTEPVFSPDGRWIAYFSSPPGIDQTHIRKVSVTGGAPVPLATFAGAADGATWRRQLILFGQNNYGCSASGRSPRAVERCARSCRLTARASEPCSPICSTMDSI